MLKRNTYQMNNFTIFNSFTPAFGKSTFILIIMLIVLFLPLHAIAAPLSSSSDKQQPIQIQSASVEFDEKKGTALYRGQVVFQQGTRHLTADSLLIKKDLQGKIESVLAKGKPAQFKAKPNPAKPFVTGHANILHYLPNQDKILLIQNAELTQNDDTIRGESLSYQLSTQVLTSNPVAGQRTTVILAPRHQGSEKSSPLFNRTKDKGSKQ
jgi:lipopolysaccharide export system protein LptA